MSNLQVLLDWVITKMFKNKNNKIGFTFLRFFLFIYVIILLLRTIYLILLLLSTTKNVNFNMDHYLLTHVNPNLYALLFLCNTTLDIFKMQMKIWTRSLTQSLLMINPLSFFFCWKNKLGKNVVNLQPLTSDVLVYLLRESMFAGF